MTLSHFSCHWRQGIVCPIHKKPCQGPVMSRWEWQSKHLASLHSGEREGSDGPVVGNPGRVFSGLTWEGRSCKQEAPCRGDRGRYSEAGPHDLWCKDFRFPALTWVINLLEMGVTLQFAE